MMRSASTFTLHQCTRALHFGGRSRHLHAGRSMAPRSSSTAGARKFWHRSKRRCSKRPMLGTSSAPQIARPHRFRQACAGTAENRQSRRHERRRHRGCARSRRRRRRAGGLLRNGKILGSEFFPMQAGSKTRRRRFSQDSSPSFTPRRQWCHPRFTCNTRCRRKKRQSSRNGCAIVAAARSSCSSRSVDEKRALVEMVAKSANRKSGAAANEIPFRRSKG